MNLHLAADGGLRRSTSIGESGVAREHGLFADFDEKIDKPSRKKAPLGRNLVEIGAEDGSKGGSVHWRWKRKEKKE